MYDLIFDDFDIISISNAFNALTKWVQISMQVTLFAPKNHKIHPKSTIIMITFFFFCLFVVFLIYFYILLCFDFKLYRLINCYFLFSPFYIIFI